MSMTQRPLRTSSFIHAIDDETSFLETLGDALVALGYRVHRDCKPRQAIEFYRETWQDVSMVMLDFLMPEMSGEFVFDELRRINPDARIVLLSGCPRLPLDSLYQKGMRGVLRKPFKIDDLARVVRDTIGETETQHVTDTPPPRRQAC